MAGDAASGGRLCRRGGLGWRLGWRRSFRRLGREHVRCKDKHGEETEDFQRDPSGYSCDAQIVFAMGTARDGGTAYCVPAVAAAAATGSGFTWMVTPLVSPLTMMDCEALA